MTHKAVIVWVSHITGKQGKVSPIPKAQADRMVKSLNIRFPNMTHKAIEVRR